MRKIYIDCTGTYYSGFNTGIPRVIRSIISRKNLAQKKFSYDLIPVVVIDNLYRRMDVNTILSHYQFLPQLGNIGKRWLFRFKNNFSSENIHIYDSIETFFRRIFTILKFLNLKIFSFNNRKEVVYFDSESVLICLDAFWSYEFEKAFSVSNQGLGKFILGIHDLIPINYSEFVHESYAKNFQIKFDRALKYADQIICVSEFTKSEVANYLKLCDKNHIEIKSIKLGGDSLPRKSKKIPQEDLLRLQDIFQGQSWLTVGTLEVRKNQSIILDAFEKIWEKGSDDKLVIIGRIGWKCDELVEKILQHTEFNKKLIFLQAAPDSWLEYAYKHSKGLIFSSHVEGFGLPVIEAMNYNLPVICSDIPAFREVAQDYAVFFDKDNVDSLVIALEKSPEKEKNIFEVPTWDKFVENLLESV